MLINFYFFFFFFQAEDGIRDYKVTGVQTCALPISGRAGDDAPLAAGRDRLGDDRARGAGGTHRDRCAAAVVGHHHAAPRVVRAQPARRRKRTLRRRGRTPAAARRDGARRRGAAPRRHRVRARAARRVRRRARALSRRGNDGGEGLGLWHRGERDAGVAVRPHVTRSRDGVRHRGEGNRGRGVDARVAGAGGAAGGRPPAARRLARRLRYVRRRRPDPHSPHAPAIHFQNLERRALQIDAVAYRRKAAEPPEQQPANRGVVRVVEVKLEQTIDVINFGTAGQNRHAAL